MKRILLLTILITCLSCEKEIYKSVDFGSFEITVPQSWKKFKVDGIDSYVGGLTTNEKDTLIFDIGWYSGDITKNPDVLIFSQNEFNSFSKKQREKLNDVKHLIVANLFEASYNPSEYLKNKYVLDNIDCFTAKLISPTNNGFGTSGIYIDSLKGSKATFNKTSMSFYGNELSDTIQVEFFKSLRSIKFKNYCN